MLTTNVNSKPVSSSASDRKATGQEGALASSCPRIVNPRLVRVGVDQCPVVVIDCFSGRLGEILTIAEDLAPYPPIEKNYYPGVRRVIGRDNEQANAYVEQTCRDAAQFIAGAFEINSFTLIEASFSLVTVPPSELSRRQRAPHFDSCDPKQLALLHYLKVPKDSGTAFYRQRSTGIERVTAANISRFVQIAQQDAARLPADAGYISGSDNFFEQIGVVEAKPDRLIIYQGSLLHSGLIPPSAMLSTDPRVGRLTANFFVLGQ